MLVGLVAGWRGMRIVFTEHRLGTPFLLKTGDRPKKAVLTQMYLITFTIVGRTISPLSLQQGILEAIAHDVSTIEADITQDVADDLDFSLFFNLHHYLPWS
jgi:hypothetical protein